MKQEKQDDKWVTMLTKSTPQQFAESASKNPNLLSELLAASVDNDDLSKTIVQTEILSELSPSTLKHVITTRPMALEDLMCIYADHYVNHRFPWLSNIIMEAVSQEDFVNNRCEDHRYLYSEKMTVLVRLSTVIDDSTLLEHYIFNNEHMTDAKWKEAFELEPGLLHCLFFAIDYIIKNRVVLPLCYQKIFAALNIDKLVRCIEEDFRAMSWLVEFGRLKYPEALILKENNVADAFIRFMKTSELALTGTYNDIEIVRIFWSCYSAGKHNELVSKLYEINFFASLTTEDFKTVFIGSSKFREITTLTYDSINFATGIHCLLGYINDKPGHGHNIGILQQLLASGHLDFLSGQVVPKLRLSFYEQRYVPVRDQYINPFEDTNRAIQEGHLAVYSQGSPLREEITEENYHNCTLVEKKIGGWENAGMFTIFSVANCAVTGLYDEDLYVGDIGNYCEIASWEELFANICAYDLQKGLAIIDIARQQGFDENRIFYKSSMLDILGLKNLFMLAIYQQEQCWLRYPPLQEPVEGIPALTAIVTDFIPQVYAFVDTIKHTIPIECISHILQFSLVFINDKFSIHPKVLKSIDLKHFRDFIIRIANSPVKGQDIIASNRSASFMQLNFPNKPNTNSERRERRMLFEAKTRAFFHQ